MTAPFQYLPASRLRTNILLGFTVFALATLCRAASCTEIVAFGDSLSDMGNRGLATNKPAARPAK